MIDNDKKIREIRKTYKKDIEEIKQWMEKFGDGQPPRFKNATGEERRVGFLLRNMQKAILFPYLKLNTIAEKEKYKKENPEVIDLLEVFKIDDHYEKIKQESLYLKNAKEIKEWLEKNGRIKPPTQWSDDLEEAKLGRKLNRICSCLIKPYFSSSDENEKSKFKNQYPELEEVMMVLYKTLKNGTSKSQIILSQLIENELKEYFQKNNEDNQDSSLKNFFKGNELDKKLDISEKSEKKPRNYLEEAKNIQLWIDDSGKFKLPNKDSKNLDERKAARNLTAIKKILISPYLELTSDEARKDYEESYPDIKEIIKMVENMERNNICAILEDSKRIKSWMEKNEKTRIPNQFSRDKEESEFGSMFRWTKRFLSNYFANKTEEEKNMYKEKYPEIKEIIQIISWIEQNNSYAYLKNAREIQEWINNSEEKKLPRKNSENEKERKFAKLLSYIRRYLINPYLDLETEEEKHEYEIVHFEIKEIMEMPYIKEMLRNNKHKEEPKYLKNAREIKLWVEASDSQKAPRTSSYDEKERKLAQAYNNIKQYCIKPYLSLKNDDEKVEYLKTHPELKEILEIVYEIDRNRKGWRTIELANYIDIELKKMDSTNVDSNQEMHSELIRKAKEFKAANIEDIER